MTCTDYSPRGRLPIVCRAGADKRTQARPGSERRSGSVDESCEQRSRQIALAEVGNDRDDRLPLGLGALRDLDGGCEGRARGYADEQSLLGSGSSSCGDGRLGGDGDDFVVQIGIEDIGDEIGAEALDLVRTRSAFGEQRRLRRFDGDELDAGLVAAQRAAGARDRPAGADA